MCKSDCIQNNSIVLFINFLLIIWIVIKKLVKNMNNIYIYIYIYTYIININNSNSSY